MTIYGHGFSPLRGVVVVVVKHLESKDVGVQLLIFTASEYLTPNTQQLGFSAAVTGLFLP